LELKDVKLKTQLFNRNYKLSLLFVSAVTLLAGCSANGIYFDGRPSQMASPEQRQAYMVAELDRVFEVYQQLDQPGISVVIKKDGDVIYQRSKGIADFEQGLEISVDTAFAIASVSKPITATAIMMLVEQNVLSLNDPVLKWLPELSASRQDITIRHLLTHQSGLPSFYTQKNLPKLDGIDNQGVVRLYAADSSVLFPPGGGIHYSNGNYVLLAEIISRSSKQPFSQFLQENIFVPFDMMSSFTAAETSPKNTKVALNFAKTSKIFGVSDRIVGPLGIFSSTADLSRFLSALNADKLISANSLHAMTSTQSDKKLPGHGGFYYGYGWVVPPPSYNKPYHYAHAGDSEGFRSLVRVYPNNDIEFIGLGNGGEHTIDLLGVLAGVVHEAYILNL